MGRHYRIYTGEQSVSAAQDLLEIPVPTDATGRILSATVTKRGSVVSEQLRVTPKTMTGGTFTSGSGGGSASSDPLSTRDPAYGGSPLERNNTTRASTTGTTRTLAEDGFNLLNGWRYLPTPELAPEASPGATIILGLETAPASARNMVAEVEIEEMGG